MDITFAAFFFILGLIVGSFLNVVIYRYNTGRSVQGRSGCLSCGKQLTALELIPLLSFIFLKGKCRGCGSKISWQYPLVELFTALMFAFLALRFSGLLFVAPMNFFIIFGLLTVIGSILIVIFVYDIKHKIIPDTLVFTFAALALIYRLFLTDFSSLNTLAWFDLFAGILFFIPFFLLWLVSRGRWIGLGDGKLVLGIGWLLGFVHGVSAIIVSFWIGALISVALVLILRLKAGSSHITMKSEVPFAPFLILGVIVVFLYPFDVFNLSLLFSL